jgi:hypothetical protein
MHAFHGRQHPSYVRQAVPGYRAVLARRHEDPARRPDGLYTLHCNGRTQSRIPQIDSSARVLSSNFEVSVSTAVATSMLRRKILQPLCCLFNKHLGTIHMMRSLAVVSANVFQNLVRATSTPRSWSLSATRSFVKIF